MIRDLVELAGGLAYTAAEKVWGHRRFAFGPPTEGFTSRVFGGTAVNRGQAGLSMTWRGDEQGAVVRFNAGMLELWLHLAGVDATVLDPGDGVGGSWVVRSEDGSERTIHMYAPVNHLGALIQWGRVAAGRGLRLTIGPVVVLVEPGAATGNTAGDAWGAS